MMDFDDISETPGLSRNSILFTAGARTRINASPKHVFEVITNLEKYIDWNQDTPKMELQGSEGLQKGSTVQMKTIMVDQNRDYNIPIEILQLEAPGANGVYVLAWRGKMLPSWFAISERVQEVHPVDGDPNICEINNFESMAGWGAYIFKYLMGVPTQMTKFNLKYLEDLKRRAEMTP